MLASQFANYINNNISKDFINGDVGTYFVEKVFKKGASLRWDELIESATGSSLSHQYLVDFIRG